MKKDEAMREAVAALLMTVAVHAGHHQCTNPKSIAEGYTPVFDFQENWSADGCGIWENESTAAPWRVAVGRTDGATCFGVLLSDYDFVTAQCNEVANDLVKEPDSVKAFLAACYDQKTGVGDAAADCKANNTGREINVENVHWVGGTDEEGAGLHLWRLADQLDSDLAPLCVFNDNKTHPGGYSANHSDHYFIYDRKWKSKMAAKMGGAPNPSYNDAKLCVQTSSCMQLHENDKKDFSSDFLVKEHKGRLMLRGFFDWPIEQGKFFTYVDVVPFIKGIVRNSLNMYLMPDVPEPKHKIDFLNATTLNQEQCGTMGINENHGARQLGTKRTSRAARKPVSEPTDFIIEGVATKVGQYPWHASISYASNFKNVFDFCGATLISEKVAITAAHCTTRYNDDLNLELAFGMHNTSDTKATDPDFISVEKVVEHPEYNPYTKKYDVTLLFLEREVNKTKNVHPICLWDDHFSLDTLKNDSGTVVGWGDTDVEGPLKRVRSPVLLAGNLSVLAHEDCYLLDKSFYSKYLHPGINFCAHGHNAANQSVAACHGDSGGGLVIKKGGAWYLRGVVSFGTSKYIEVNGDKKITCDEKAPSLYVDLACCMPWILHQLSQRP